MVINRLSIRHRAGGVERVGDTNNKIMLTSTDKISLDFQTPPEVCKYMTSLVPPGAQTVLEPTPGIGNIVAQLSGYKVTALTGTRIGAIRLGFHAM